MSRLQTYEMERFNLFQTVTAALDKRPCRSQKWLTCLHAHTAWL